MGWAQQHPIIGKWKSNPAKSRVLYGEPGLNYVATFEASGPNGIKYVSERIGASSGRKSVVQFTANLDGKTYPYKAEGGPASESRRDGISLTAVDSHTIRVAYKEKGETVQLTYWIVSKDGNTLTSLATNATFSRMIVADRQ